MRALRLLALTLLVTPAIGDAQVTLRPGQYEYTLELNLPVPAEATGAVLSAAGFDKQKKLECVTPEDVKDANDIPGMFAREMGDECKVSDVTTSGNRLSFTATCVDDDVRMTMTSEMTFTADGFTAITKGKDNEGRVSTGRMTARRIGECPK
jgi:hypothetical protein